MKKAAQAGIISPPLIIGGIVVLVVIFLIATGSFKFSASVKPNPNQPSKQQEQQTPTPEPTAKPKTYKNEANGISLEYPANWKIKENPAAGYFVAFYSPKENSNDDYTEFLWIKVLDTSSRPDYTLLEVADLWENQTRNASKNDAFNVTDRKSSQISGVESRDIVYTAKFGGKDMKGMVRIVLNKNKGYVFQYNAMANAYDKFLPEIESILTSVKF